MSDVLNSNLDAHRKELFRAMALAFPALVLLALEPAKIPDSLLILSTAAFWMTSFARPNMDNRALGLNLVFTASLLILLLPSGMLWWQILLTVSFGVVMGEQIFGGRRYSFLSPVIVALAFQFYSFADLDLIAANSIALTFLLPPFLLLFWSRQINWQAMLGVVIGFISLGWIVLGSESLQSWLDSSSPCATAVLVCVLFAACDPAISPRTEMGRWLYGCLIGILQFLFDPSVQLLQKTVFACLLGSVAAPLIDWIVIATLNYNRSDDSSSEQHVTH